MGKILKWLEANGYVIASVYGIAYSDYKKISLRKSYLGGL